MKASKKRGFTIVELIIVIAVIAILAAVLIPTFSNLISRANESVDIQAARNMNTFLATAKYTDGVNSILDVYDVFEDSGFKVENYSPLYKGRHYYYDIGYNKILYVDDNRTVLYPEEHKGEQKGDRNWCSLSMETMKITEPKDGGSSYVKENNKITATVKSPEEYAYVIDQYNRSGSSSLSLDLTLKNDLDFMGANCAILETKGSVTIKSEGTNRVTIKNITSNVQLETDTVRNDQNIKADYYSGGLISKVKGTVLIENVVIENINVKTPTAGQVGVVIGVAQGGAAKVTFKDVTVKNCSVIGHRDVGTLVGGAQQAATVTLQGNVNIENVKVKTTGGRSALVVGKLNDRSQIVSTAAEVKITNSALEVYKMESLKQQFANKTDGWKNVKSTSTIEGQTQYIYSLKATDGKQEYSAYGFRADALVLLEQKNGAPYKVVTAVSGLNGAAAQ